MRIIHRVLASQIKNLELKNKDKTTECELLKQQLEDLKDKAVTKPSKPLLPNATSFFVQEVQPSTSKTGI